MISAIARPSIRKCTSFHSLIIAHMFCFIVSKKLCKLACEVIIVKEFMCYPCVRTPITHVSSQYTFGIGGDWVGAFIEGLICYGQFRNYLKLCVNSHYGQYIYPPLINAVHYLFLPHSLAQVLHVE